MLFPNMDYIKTMLNGISTKLSEIGKRAVQGNWQQNDPEASDYIKNRCGGYHVTNTRKVHITPEWPDVIDNTTGIMIKRIDVGTSCWVIHVSDDIPSPDELSSAEIDAVGFGPEICNFLHQEKDVYYLDKYEEIVPSGSLGPLLVLVVTKPTTIRNVIFDRPGLYIGCTTQFSEKTAYVTSMSYERSEDTIVKIPQEYVDGAGSLRVNITVTYEGYTADHTFEDIKQAYDQGMTVCAIFNSVNIPLLLIDDNMALFDVFAIYSNEEPYIKHVGIPQPRASLVITNNNRVIVINNPFEGSQVFVIPQQFVILVNKNTDGTYTADKTFDWMEKVLANFIDATKDEGLPDIVAVLGPELFHLTSINPFIFVHDGEVTKILTCTRGSNGGTWSYEEVAGGASSFIVNITGSESEGWKADKTFQEIDAAIASGIMPVCKMPRGVTGPYEYGVCYYVFKISPPRGDSFFIFRNIDADKYFSIYTVVRMYSSNSVDVKRTTVGMVGATETMPGEAGYVPSPKSGDNTKFLRGDGTWADVPKYELPVAAKEQLGGVKPVAKTDVMTQDVGVDENGKLYTKPAEGGTDLSLGITGAQVGQIAKIAAVDTDGKPTKWESVDLPSGAGGASV